MKKRLKIKWKNVGLLIVLMICAGVVIHDIYMISIQPWINGQMAGWTWFGFITFLAAFFVGGEIVEYFIEEFNNSNKK